MVDKNPEAQSQLTLFYYFIAIMSSYTFSHVFKDMQTSYKEVLHSSWHYCFGSNWRIEFIPCGEKMNQEDCVSIFLEYSGNPIEVCLQFRVQSCSIDADE